MHANYMQVLPVDPQPRTFTTFTNHTVATGGWPIPQYFPGPTPEPFVPDCPPYLPPPFPGPGRWEWIPDFGCAACRHSGVCMCYRPGRDSVTFSSPGNTLELTIVS